ncbi:hypothetical protein [Achromobacter insolitus]|uniref:hypothetical protein n=1 Tax=Achromobacter insolitus TaxID=217204 RepID=UPI0013E2E2CD|nr:hypothetical protein [Achromobacter insolitus]NGT18257.1 hypothetical protein [Achromobacter insolitus]
MGACTSKLLLVFCAAASPPHKQSVSAEIVLFIIFPVRICCANPHAACYSNIGRIDE